jgi:hypothetical protein
MSERTSSKISRAAIRQRLNLLGIHGDESETVARQTVDNDLAARLQSLAIASSMNSQPTPARVIRRALVIVGRVNAIGWIAVAAVVAAISLSSVNVLPDPFQTAMSNVFNVVGINVPNPEDEPIRVRQTTLDPAVTTTVAP